MDKQDNINDLDLLDVQVSMGRIDQATYDTLRQKWVQQLQEITVREASGTLSIVATNGKSTPERITGALVPVMEMAPAQAFTPLPEEQSRYTVEVLACPKCAAPTALQAGQDLTQPVQCLFCDTVYTVRQSQDNAQQLKKELKAWLAEKGRFLGHPIGPSMRRLAGTVRMTIAAGFCPAQSVMTPAKLGMPRLQG